MRGMNGGKQKDVVLILARELASNIATPMLVLDETGTIVFFNEAAERILGATFESVGEVSPDEYDAKWATTDPDGNEISLRHGPMARVVSDHTPAHRVIRVRGLDGAWHLIETTVYPLFAERVALRGRGGRVLGARRCIQPGVARFTVPHRAMKVRVWGTRGFAGVTRAAHGALRRQHVVRRRHLARRHAACARRRFGHP